MATGSDFIDYDYPSLSGVFLFWDKAQEEFGSQNPADKKQACEKAYRASTEAIDLLLAKFGHYIPVGHPEAHALRSNYIMELYDVIPEMKQIDHYYSTFKDKLHGLGFYSGFDANRYQKIFNQVDEFIKLVQKVLEA